MNVSVENLGPCKKLLRVEVPVEKVNAVFDQVAGEFQKAVHLPGFRPGKAPRHLILRSYEPKIEEEARKKLVQDSFRDAARQENLSVVVTLGVEEQQFGRNQSLQFTATVEVAPAFTLPNYKGIAAKRELTVATDADVERALGILREQQAKFEDVQRPLQEGDVAVVNYSGTCEGQPLTALAPTAAGLTSKENSWVLVKPGALSRVGDLANRLVADPDAFVRHYVPESDDVLVWTSVAEPGDTQTIHFAAPSAPGRYPFLCTFPGHWMVMNGELVVEAPAD